jgi:uncharacterized RDD family membrane protein YckC
LSAAPAPDDPELPLNDRSENPLPPVDLSLDNVEGLTEARERGAAKSTPFDIERVTGAADLPLFKVGSVGSAGKRAATAEAAGHAADEPLVRPSPVPRAPIAVRRATPELHRLRSRYSVAEVPRLDLDAVPERDEPVEEEEPVESRVQVVPAPPVRRLLAGIIDALIVNGINSGVVYFTLKLCDLPLTIPGVLEIPPVPLVGFLLLIDAGYFISFTSVIGQTIGKMATGLRVTRINEAGEDQGHPNFGFSTLRTAAYGASILPVGLGFLPALFGKDRRALHDRLAETRVVFSGKLMV